MLFILQKTRHIFTVEILIPSKLSSDNVTGKNLLLDRWESMKEKYDNFIENL